MDNISHAVFGGSIIHAIRGKKYGSKATGYALLASNIPDVDILFNFLPVDTMQFGWAHRTMTHSFVFALFIAPIMGRIIAKITKSGKVGWKDWTLITLVSILSHIFLDWCTTYGVRFLWPFSDVSFEARIISVIDMFYTLPLLAIVVWYLVSSRRKKVNRTYIKRPRTRFIGVGFATCYLAIMACMQFSLTRSIEHDMILGGVTYNRVLAAPQMLQPFLWYGVVELPEGAYKITHTSVFDTKPRVYENVYGYHELTSSLVQNNSDVVALIRRAHAWYKLEVQGNNTFLYDLRFPRILGWDKELRGDYGFAHVVDGDERGRQRNPRFSQPFAVVWDKYRERVWGN